MGTDSGVDWTTNTWGPWRGCRKVSTGCKFCYAEADFKRYGRGPFSTVTRAARQTFRAPLGRTRSGAWRWADGAFVFCPVWSDWFIEEADPWRSEAWDIIAQRPGLRFQILTKRIERAGACLPEDWHGGYGNVWLGTSVEHQATAHRLDVLATLRARVRFASVEPLLGPVKLPSLEALDWLIVGGESGVNARPCDADWIRDVIAQGDAAGVPVFVKQLGARFHDADQGLGGRLNRDLPERLRSHKGSDPAEWPADLRRRELPAGFTL